MRRNTCKEITNPHATHKRSGGAQGTLGVASGVLVGPRLEHCCLLDRLRLETWFVVRLLALGVLAAPGVVVIALEVVDEVLHVLHHAVDRHGSPSQLQVLRRKVVTATVGRQKVVAAAIFSHVLRQCDRLAALRDGALPSHTG